MRKSLLLLLLTSGVAYADQNNPTPAELKATVVHIQSLAKELQVNLDKEKQEHAGVSSDLIAAQKDTIQLQKDVITLTNKANDAIASHDHILGKLHLAKFIVSAAVTAAIAFALLYMAIPPPLLFYIGIGAAAAANTAIWIWL